ncbi:LysR family transcriptional regulator [Microbacterium sp. B19]|uniref:LysR family transcriptional regulator n=1 Tax=Microbacterium sp. B19 TaxID=96765 RepID=UPI00034C9470|nr:LysR family transcriptional regulator [Microbacterium sp. B19]
MELKQLEYFVSAAEELSFTRAARRCHVVQSAISAQIKGLEAELGTPLFDRTTHRVSLTAEGTVLLERARGILRLVDDTRDLVSPTSAELSGSLSIGVTQGAWKGMAPALASFRAAHPPVRIGLRQAPTVRLFESVNDGSLDIAVAPLRRPSEPGLFVKTLYTENLSVGVGASHELAHRESLALRDLDQRDAVGFCPFWALRTITDRAFDEAKAFPRVAYEVNDLNAAAEIVASGLAYVLLPDHLLAQFGDLIRIPLEDDVHWDVGVIASARRCTPAAAALMDLLT